MPETETRKPYIYLAGDIMSFGSNLARKYEYDKFTEAQLDADVYSPVLNKSINDKANMTEEENNALAEKITYEDIRRLWTSDCVVISPEQSAIGTMCELGCLYGWKYIGNIINNVINSIVEEIDAEPDKPWDEAKLCEFERKFCPIILTLCDHTLNKGVFAHYFDIRNNHLNEKDWRRSFSINQLLYGMILDTTTDGQLNGSFNEVMPKLKEWVDKWHEANDKKEKHEE